MLMTKWGQALDRQSVLQEYPRPQLRRDSYLNLNGEWRYAITQGDSEPAAYDGVILVPFSPESELSGVGRTLSAQQTLWYRRELVFPEGFLVPGGRVLLHFGAVDQTAEVMLNGAKLFRHLGGYNAFTVDITDALGEQNTLVLRVTDDTDQSWHTRGKQKTKRGGIWYTPQSGVWQTVWLESVPAGYVRALRIVPHVDSGEVELTVFSDADAPCEVLLQGERYAALVNRPARIPVKDCRLWSPDDPYLYDFNVKLGADEVQSYFGMRSVCVKPDDKGVPRFFLNGKPCFLNGLLDQGYWPDGLYTAPSDDALIFDIQTAKRLGYNLLRKHIKVEPMRWYYHCDRLGMLVWQDMPSGGGRYHTAIVSGPLVTGIHLRDSHHHLFARGAAQGCDEYRAELDEMVRQLYNAPSLVTWVPFNEGWGQFDAVAAEKRVRALDPSRPIDHASGWHDQGAGDFKSLHVYFKPYRFARDPKNRAVALTEFGGYNLRLDGHCLSDADYGYRRLPDRDALWQAYQKLYETEILPAIPKGLSVAVYTQLSDVEDELNGIMTYDRAEVKLDERKLAELNGRLGDVGEAPLPRSLNRRGL